MAVQRGTFTLASAMAALAALANSKDIEGKPYRFVPECFEVDSQGEMLLLGHADRGELPGGIAVRTDTLTAYQLTGNFRLAAGWTAYALTVVTDMSGLPAGAAEGTYAYVVAVGLMRKTSGAWTFWTWRSELDRLRGKIVKRITGGTLFDVKPVIRDGEQYWLEAPIYDGSFSLNRYASARPTLNLFQVFTNQVGFWRAQDPLFVYPTSAGSPIGDFHADAICDLTFVDGLTLEMRLRVETPIELDFGGTQNLPIQTFGRTGTLAVILSGDTPGIARVEYPTATSARLVFQGKINSGDYFLRVRIDSSQGTYSFTPSSPTPFVTLTKGNIGFASSGNGIHNSSGVAAIGFLPEGQYKAIRFYRWSSNLPGQAGNPGWVNGLQGSSITVSGVSDGFFLSRQPLLAGITHGERATTGPNTGKLILAPHAEEAAVGTDYTVTPAMISPVPRMFFSSSEQTDLKIPATNIFVTRGSTVRAVHVRRQPIGTPALAPKTGTIVVKIGCFRNGAFAELISLNLTESTTFYPDWVNFTQNGLAYQASEELDIQAVMVPPSPPISIGGTPGEYVPISIGADHPLLAEHFNATESILQQLT